MKKILLFSLYAIIGIGAADAAVRDGTAVTRQNSIQNATVSRTAVTPSTTTRTATARTTANTVTRDISTRANESTVSRAATTTQRSATKTATTRTATVPATLRSASTARSATQKKTSTARAAIATTSQTFGTGYNACRESYFTCMDQFCAKSDDTYRRCVCSSRLEEIKSKERALGQTANQLQDFKDLNIDVINKTGAEVKAMISASDGESSIAKDKSKSAQQLAGISAVLNKTKTESLSTQGKLDIAGDINAIWSTTDLAAGSDLSNLTGEKLYNAVHAQCAEFARQNCESNSVMNMVISAYGMYIENDCSNLSSALGKKTIEAQSAIRSTEREMNVARLDNYNAHNSTSINDCIAQVRKDITSETACGPDYVHCLDITGKYLNRDTGEPIYTSNFYQLELQTSLSGDVLSNQTNRLLVAELNRKREFAARGLDTCRDLSNEVWDEFMRQAIAEIYQGQQERIRSVKTECIDVVNNCYDTQSKSLKDFSNVKEQLLIGSRLELSEQMCIEKLDACRNLYGVNANDELKNVMDSLTDQKIAQNCKTALIDYAKEICMVTSNDIVHGYPFACRTYAPGEQKYATNPACNVVFTNNQTLPGITLPGEEDNDSGNGDGTTQGPGYSCPIYKKYTSCNTGYYMSYNGQYNGTPKPGNKCIKCSIDWDCPGGTNPPSIPDDEEVDPTKCNDNGDYIGSLYQKMVRYAMQTCVRPSYAEDKNNVIPTTVLADVNVVMDSLKVEMGKQLSAECERFGGVWIDTPWVDKDEDTYHDSNGYQLWPEWDAEVSADKRWGFCIEQSTSLRPSPIRN